MSWAVSCDAVPFADLSEAGIPKRPGIALRQEAQEASSSFDGSVLEAEMT